MLQKGKQNYAMNKECACHPFVNEETKFVIGLAERDLFEFWLVHFIPGRTTPAPRPGFDWTFILFLILMSFKPSPLITVMNWIFCFLCENWTLRQCDQQKNCALNGMNCSSLPEMSNWYMSASSCFKIVRAKSSLAASILKKISLPCSLLWLSQFLSALESLQLYLV